MTRFRFYPHGAEGRWFDIEASDATMAAAVGMKIAGPQGGHVGNVDWDRP